jgi:hypothetical protein
MFGQPLPQLQQTGSITLSLALHTLTPSTITTTTIPPHLSIIISIDNQLRASGKHGYRKRKLGLNRILLSHNSKLVNISDVQDCHHLSLAIVGNFFGW